MQPVIQDGRNSQITFPVAAIILLRQGRPGRANPIPRLSYCAPLWYPLGGKENTPPEALNHTLGSYYPFITFSRAGLAGEDTVTDIRVSRYPNYKWLV
ncbi:unnamed protein product [Nezara viridula]|uniref:Uncharacterized protein n=1 Tax=Nezara viridula TaxID=85310 RepID=A0A9P0H0Z9_NEZVI|nr:unnamed protein product [Nezara viridula]